MKLLRSHFPFLVLLFICEVGWSQKTTPNTHPSWSAQSNIYEINLRQYSASGSIADFEKHLSRLKKMGVEILWFMPINPIGIEGRKQSASDLGSYYAVRDYKGFNEEFGTMAQWKLFVIHAHKMGFKVLIDWVANHSSPDNGWITRHPNFYKKDSNGVIMLPNPDWTDTRKLDYSSKELRDTMIDAMKFWIKVTGIDGFRCDAAAEVPNDFWKQCISALKKLKDVYMLAEADDPSLHLAGFDATYTWNLMSEMQRLYEGRQNLIQYDSALQNNMARFPQGAHRLFFTTNHDENSWNGTEFEKYGDAFKTFAVFSQTMYQSVPLIYNGQEVMNKRRLKFFVKDTIEWGNYVLAPFYKTLLELRRKDVALAADAAFTRIKTANDAAIYAYTREKNGHKVFVILNFSAHPQQFTIKQNSICGGPTDVFSMSKVQLGPMHVYSLKPWDYLVYEY